MHNVNNIYRSGKNNISQIGILTSLRIAEPAITNESTQPTPTMLKPELK